MRRRDNDCPVGYTCPIIDAAIDFIKGIEGIDNADIKWTVEQLEELRRENQSLRNWGSDQRTRADEAEESVEELNSEISKLRDELEDLKSEYKSLEKQINDFEVQNV